MNQKQENDTYIWLLPMLEFVPESNGFYIKYQYKTYRSELFSKPILDFLLTIDGNSTEDQLNAHPIFSIMKPFLEKMGWIVRLRNPIDFYIQNYEVYTRQLSYYAHICKDFPDDVLFALQSKSVAVIGMGGIGSLAAHNLAGAGIGSLHLFDFDTIELTNFNRQILYTADDLGKPKSESAANFLRNKFPGIRIDSYNVNFDIETSDLDGFDLIVICGECYGFYSKPHILDRKNVIRSGYAGATGIIGPTITSDSAVLWSDLVSKNKDSRIGSFVEPLKRVNCWNSSGSTINTVVAGLLSEECLRFFCPQLGPIKTTGHEINIRMEDFEISYRPVGRTSDS